MAYTIEVTSAARRSLKKLDADAAQRIADAIEELAATPRPHGCKKLSAEDDIYRIRVGVYRILYQVQDKHLVVLVIQVGHRREVYR